MLRAKPFAVGARCSFTRQWSIEKIHHAQYVSRPSGATSN